MIRGEENGRILPSPGPRRVGFWVSGFGFRVLGFGFRVLGFRFGVSGFGFGVEGLVKFKVDCGVFYFRDRGHKAATPMSKAVKCFYSTPQVGGFQPVSRGLDPNLPRLCAPKPLNTADNPRMPKKKALNLIPSNPTQNP